MNFEDITFPHIMYLSEIQSLNEKERTRYYLGGEDEEIHMKLTVGKKYVIRTASYSPSRNIPRVSVWICDDENKGKVLQINPNNFGNLADLRNKKIKTIIDGSNLS